MQYKVKVCGMRDAENIEDILVLRPDYMGFIFYERSPRFVGTYWDALVLMKVMYAEVQPVAVVVDMSIDELNFISEKYAFSTFQLHGSESPEYCSVLKEKGFVVIKAFGVDEVFDFDQLADYESYCDYFLFDTKTKDQGGSGKTFNWDKLKEYPSAKPFFLSGGVGPEHRSILEDLPIKPYAIDLNSRFETAPGLKDVTMLRAFIDNY